MVTNAGRNMKEPAARVCRTPSAACVRGQILTKAPCARWDVEEHAIAREVLTAVGFIGMGTYYVLNEQLA